jgi:hypothetical protein
MCRSRTTGWRTTSGRLPSGKRAAAIMSLLHSARASTGTSPTRTSKTCSNGCRRIRPAGSTSYCRIAGRQLPNGQRGPRVGRQDDLVGRIRALVATPRTCPTTARSKTVSSMAGGDRQQPLHCCRLAAELNYSKGRWPTGLLRRGCARGPRAHVAEVLRAALVQPGRRGLRRRLARQHRPASLRRRTVPRDLQPSSS